MIVQCIPAIPAFSFADLGTGTVYGSRIYTPADSGTNQAIALNDAALAAINPNTPFGAGGRITTLSGQMAVDEYVFGSSQFLAGSRLEITTTATARSPWGVDRAGDRIERFIERFVLLSVLRWRSCAPHTRKVVS
jgi:hypothetical protein